MAEASGFKPADLTRVYRLMRTARRLDDREILLKRQSKIYFPISGAGHEAIGVAVGSVLRPGYDSFYLYYRDRALALTLGITSEEMLLGSVGAAADPASGGRQMPSHFFDPARNIALVSSCTGTQYLQALGCADAVRNLHPGENRIVLVSSGDGATSEGEFWESINQACLNRSPMMFLVEDNGYAIFRSGRPPNSGWFNLAPAHRFPRPFCGRDRWQRFSGDAPRRRNRGRLYPGGSRSRAGSRQVHAPLLPLAF